MEPGDEPDTQVTATERSSDLGIFVSTFGMDSSTYIRGVWKLR